MNNDDHDNRLLDEMLERNYEPLRQPVLGQREAFLSGLSQARASAQAASWRTWRRIGAWLATAACVVAAITVAALLRPPSAGMAYGIEAVPKRLLAVQTIRIRGSRMVYDQSKPDRPPLRVPIEYLVNRPNKFRHTWVGVSQGVGPPEIRRGSQICDGSVEWMVNDSQKQCLSVSISPLEARLKTEMAAQGLIMLAVLGPPDAPTSYKKSGEETTDGRRCDIYERRFGEGISIIATVWVDRTSGDLVRVVHDEVQSDGTTRRIMEFDDISLNLPLADQLFSFAAPEGYKTLNPMPAKADQQALLEPMPNYSASSNGDTLEVWQAFRISDDAGLLLWRRSTPRANGDAARDWLSNIEMKLVAPQQNVTLHHAWLYQAESPEQWNWSLVAMKDGRWPDHAAIRLELRGRQGRSTLEILALRFSDQELAQLVMEASRATLPEMQTYSLENIRRRAGELVTQ